MIKTNFKCYSFPIFIFLISGFLFCCHPDFGRKRSSENVNYLNNRAPLVPNPYIELPLGAIRPRGWLLEQLIRQKSGLTGHLDEYYSQVVGPRNGWLGGDGDGWERGPYWLDGLVPLAYILKDSFLIDKAKPWIEWSLDHQREDGYFGPVPFKNPPSPEPGLQKGMREDWWPKIVMLKVLKQYYEATGDKRVINLMTEYFRYQLKKLPVTPLDHWSFWANRRGGDNLMVVYWLYNITGDKFLLDLAELIYKQTYPYTQIFLNGNCERQNSLSSLYPYNTGNKFPFNDSLINRLCVSQIQSFHGVNLSQGIKEPLIYYQAHHDSIYLEAVRKALRDLALYHGQAQGMFGADEPIHGNDPTKGIEFCSVVEMMYSLEKMIAITGEVKFADHLERIAFNALPTQATDDFMARQYFQSANQPEITRGRHGFFEDDNNGGTSLCYGLLTGYPCCTCNMHQGWPKFTQNLFYASADNGVGAMIFAPSEVNIFVADHIQAHIVEETRYPFDDHISFHISLPSDTEFPFHIRIPSWCKIAVVSINNQILNRPAGGQIITVDRTWHNGDILNLEFPMDVTTSRWYMNSVAIERGPLVYSLKVTGDRNFVKNNDQWGNFYEIKPLSPWNYGLISKTIMDPAHDFKVIKSSSFPPYPWNVSQSPIEIKTVGRLIPDWKLYNDVPGPMPPSGSFNNSENLPADSIILIPYGCTSLRMTEFPVIN